MTSIKRATGTDGRTLCASPALPPALPPDSEYRCISLAIAGNNPEADTVFVRGTSDVFNLEKKVSKPSQPKKKLNWVVFSATQSYQNNYEYKLNGEYFGSLSYAVKLALSDLSAKTSFSELFELIQSKRTNMKVSGYPQRPMIDGADFYKNQIAF